MTSRLFITLLIALLLAGAVVAEPWRIAPRELPPPAGASEEVQALISAAPQPDLRSRSVYPIVPAQWRQLQEARAKQSAISLGALGQQLGVAITRDEIAGVAVHRVTPLRDSKAAPGRVFVYIHGGAYVFGGGDAGVREGALISSLSGIPVVSVDYRMPPDHPHPAAVNDVTAVYREVLKTYPAGAVAMGGTSAGGGLTLAAVHQFKRLELPVPGALYLGTPWTDLTKSSDTLYTNEGIDRVVPTYDGLLAAAARLYAGDTDLRDPLVSPVYGEFDEFPPTYLVSGTRDILLSDTVRVHRKLRVAGVEADLNVYEGLSHAEYAMAGDSPEFRQVYGELVVFLDKHLASN